MTPPVPLADLFTPEDFVASLEVSLTGINLLRPVYEPGGSTITDFALEYLNPAAQRMTGLSAQPGGTTRTHFPDIFTNGVFDFHRRVFETGEAGHYSFNYQADGFDNYFHVAARRSGDRLIVSFTDTADQDRSPVELALRESQAAEQAARAETETQRQRLFHILENFPAVVASYRGPEHVFELVSHQFQQDFPTRTIKGLPVREALPELEGQGYYDILAGVYRTGEPFYGTEIETWVDLTNTGKLELHYYNVCFQATRDAQGRIDGVLNFAYDVTDAVLARQQVQQLNQELEALTEELRASNKEYQQANTDLSETQRHVQQLNQELEARVQARTREAVALQADLLLAAQQQAQARETFYKIFEQTPALVALLREPGHRFEYVNPAYQAFFPVPLVGLTVSEAAPELFAQGFGALLDRVYQTGETHFGVEVPFTPIPARGQRPQTRYFNFTYQAYRENGRWWASPFSPSR